MEFTAFIIIKKKVEDTDSDVASLSQVNIFPNIVFQVQAIINLIRIRCLYRLVESMRADKTSNFN